LTVALILTPVQFIVGDTAAREVAKDQPAKFAAMECVEETHSDVTEYLGGKCDPNGVEGGIGIPGLDSFLVGFSRSTTVTGLDSVPPRDRPPANTLLHWAFDAMVATILVLRTMARRWREDEDAEANGDGPYSPSGPAGEPAAIGSAL
jgi:cytochrome d ubiquinol oxidase subunit I